MTIVGTLNQKNREQWIERTLKKIPAGSLILDAGAGEQQYRKYCSHLQYVSQDFGKYEGLGDRRGLQTGTWNQSTINIISDIVEIPRPNQSFDAIMCIEVFEHIPEPIKAINEFERLLKPGGHLIITAPFCSLTHFAPFHFSSGYNRYFYEKFLPINNFKILELQENGNYFEYIAQEIRRIPDIAERYSYKNPSFLESISMKVILNMLGRFSSNDQGSNEILHFGYQIYAIKEIKLPNVPNNPAK